VNKKEVHKDDVSFYVKNVDLIYVREKYSNKEHKGETIETDGSKFLLDALKVVGRIPIYRDIFQLGRDKGKV
jgi:hypothetical protein